MLFSKAKRDAQPSFYLSHDGMLNFVWKLSLSLMVIVFIGDGYDSNPVSAQAPKKIVAPLAIIESPVAGSHLQVKVEEDFYAKVRSEQSVRLTDFPLTPDSLVELELEQFFITTTKIRIVAATDTGEFEISHPQIALFKGYVTDMPDSKVFLGISSSGMRGLVQMTGNQYVVAPIKDRLRTDDTLLHQIYDRSAEQQLDLNDPANRCGTETALQELLDLPDNLGIQADSSQFRFGRVALECDYEFWDRFNSMDQALTYIYQIFGAASVIYETDLSVKLVLPFIRIWTTINDPYSHIGGGGEAQWEFQDYWRDNHSTPGQPGYIERDMAHMLSGRGVEARGNISQLCKEYGYSISGGNAAPNGFQHDLVLAAHEIGHVFGGRHSHCFDPPIDKCATAPDCNDTQDCNTVPGTIMSYCHFCPGGFNNFLHEFHTKNIAGMRTVIDSSCLGIARAPVYVDWRNVGFEDGTAGNPYNTVVEGAESVLPGGTVRITGGNYAEQITIWQPMTLTAPSGSVTIGE